MHKPPVEMVKLPAHHPFRRAAVPVVVAVDEDGTVYWCNGAEFERMRAHYGSVRKAWQNTRWYCCVSRWRDINAMHEATALPLV